jgi:hypothetical protein
MSKGAASRVGDGEITLSCEELASRFVVGVVVRPPPRSDASDSKSTIGPTNDVGCAPAFNANEICDNNGLRSRRGGIDSVG